LDQDETLLFGQGVSVEKLHWRRREINETYKGDLDAFHQQYPATPDEAFVTSGRPVFPMTIVNKKIQESVKHDFRQGYLRWKGSEVVFDEDRYGYWKIWEEPVRGPQNLYVCGADVAEELRSSLSLATVVVISRQRGYSDATAARWLLRFMPELIPICLQRNSVKPTTIIEVRFSQNRTPERGNVIISRLRDDPLLELIRTPSFGKKRLEIKEEYGWETTGGKAGSTKRMAIDGLYELIREESFTDYDKTFG